MSKRRIHDLIGKADLYLEKLASPKETKYDVELSRFSNIRKLEDTKSNVCNSKIFSRL